MYMLPFGDPNPRTRRTCHSSTLVAEEMWSRDTSVTASPQPHAALGRGSKEPLQLLLETSHAPKANPIPWASQQGWAGSWCGQGELLPAVAGTSRGPSVQRLAAHGDSLSWLPAPHSSPRDTDLWPTIRAGKPLLRSINRDKITAWGGRACPAPLFPTEGRAPAQ